MTPSHKIPSLRSWQWREDFTPGLVRFLRQQTRSGADLEAWAQRQKWTPDVLVNALVWLEDNGKLESPTLWGGQWTYVKNQRQGVQLPVKRVFGPLGGPLLIPAVRPLFKGNLAQMEFVWISNPS